MDGEILVQVEDLGYSYGASGVRELGFTLHRGQVLGFLGPNGAGKSTTLRLLTGNLIPDTGRILIHSVDLLRDPCRAKARLGYLPEHPPVYRELTVDEYLRYCARLHRVPRTAIRTAVQRAKDSCGLAERGRCLIGTLSKGYQQRVGIAQAILHAPSVIVLDEPTVGLDPLQRREICDLIKALGQQHGVILSTHILSEVQTTCSHVQILHEGRLVYSDSLSALDRRSLIVELCASLSPTDVAGLPDVIQVEDLGGHRFRLHHRPAADPAAIAAAIHARGWGLRQLAPEHGSLEQVFIDLTLGRLDRVAA